MNGLLFAVQIISGLSGETNLLITLSSSFLTVLRLHRDPLPGGASKIDQRDRRLCGATEESRQRPGRLHFRPRVQVLDEPPALDGVAA